MAASTRVLSDNDDYFVLHFASETTDAVESDVVKIDSSAYCGKNFTIEEIWWSVSGLKVRLYWEATTDELFLGFGANNVTGNGHLNFSSIGGVSPPSSAGSTGDIGLSTQNPDTGDSYAFIIKCKKV